MTTITISDLATAPQINSRRVAHDLIEWLAHRGWVIVQGEPELPLGRDPYPPAPLPPAAAETEYTPLWIETKPYLDEWSRLNPQAPPPAAVEPDRPPATDVMMAYLREWGEILPTRTEVEYWQRIGAGLDA